MPTTATLGDLEAAAPTRLRQAAADFFADGVRVASFAEGRIGYREWARRNGKLGEIHSIDDRYDHDVDELMA